jgi:hypothetical protein
MAIERAAGQIGELREAKAPRLAFVRDFIRRPSGPSGRGSWS